jgi:hypothetical protein
LQSSDEAEENAEALRNAENDECFVIGVADASKDEWAIMVHFGDATFGYGTVMAP